MKKHKFIAVILTTLLLTSIIPYSTAFAADDDFSVTCEVSPPVLPPEGGYIELTLHVTNHGALVIDGHDLEVYTDTTYYESWKTHIEPGATLTHHVIKIPISEKDLNTEISAQLSINQVTDPYDPNTSEGIQTFSFFIRSAESSLISSDDFSVTYDVSPPALPPEGGDAVLILHITNHGVPEIRGNDIEVYTTAPYFESWKTSIMSGKTVTSYITVPLADTDLSRKINVVLHMEHDEIPGSDGIQTFTFLVESPDESSAVESSDESHTEEPPYDYHDIAFYDMRHKYCSLSNFYGYPVCLWLWGRVCENDLDEISEHFEELYYAIWNREISADGLDSDHESFSDVNADGIADKFDGAPFVNIGLVVPCDEEWRQNLDSWNIESIDDFGAFLVVDEYEHFKEYFDLSYPAVLMFNSDGELINAYEGEEISNEQIAADFIDVIEQSADYKQELPAQDIIASIPQNGVNVTIKGILQDENGNPLTGMTVDMPSCPCITATDEQGRFTVEGVSLKDHIMVIKQPSGETLKPYHLSISEGSSFFWIIEDDTIDIVVGQNIGAIEIKLSVNNGNAEIISIEESGGAFAAKWYVWVITAAGVVLVALVICLIVFSKKRKKEKDE